MRGNEQSPMRASAMRSAGAVAVLACLAAGCAAAPTPAATSAATTAPPSKEPAASPAVVTYQDAGPVFRTASELAERADLIVRSTVESSDVRELDTRSSAGQGASGPEANPGGSTGASGMVVTVHRVTVLAVHKGSAKVGNLIEVKEPGGLFRGTRYETSEGIVLADGSTYLLFLETYPDSPASLVSRVQGVYEVSGAQLKKRPGNDLDVTEVAKLAG